jgi:GNAT superfamily N-acetyltransferase
MSKPQIHWKIQRMDEGDEPDLRFAECLLEIEGRIECGGQTAGLVDAHYLYAEDPASDAAFMELWDLDAASCDVFEEIMDHDIGDFQEPIPHFLEPASGILVVRFIALRPSFRHTGLGREVMKELVRTMADPRIGLVLLDCRPLQHRPHGYDDFDDEVRDLPWNSPDEDREKLKRHFETWGMQRLPGTRFMMAAPESLRDSRAPQWPPCPVLDGWNTCVACGGWIDREGDAWLESGDGPIHRDCM